MRGRGGQVVTGLKSYFSTGWNAFEFLVLAGLVGVTYLKALAHQPPRPATHAWLR